MYFIDKTLDSCVKNSAWHNGVDMLDRQGKLLDIISSKITSPHNPLKKLSSVSCKHFILWTISCNILISHENKIPAKLIWTFSIIFYFVIISDSFRFPHSKKNSTDSGYFYKTFYFNQKVRNNSDKCSNQRRIQIFPY